MSGEGHRVSAKEVAAMLKDAIQPLLAAHGRAIEELKKVSDDARQ
jgi:hypothetical protein